MSSSESNGRRNKRRRKRRGARQAPPSTPASADSATAAVIEDTPPADEPVRNDDDVAEQETLEESPELSPGDSPNLDVVDDSTDDVDDDSTDDVVDDSADEVVDDSRGAGSEPTAGVRTEDDVDRLAELTCELIERDELIAALTEQLEDAADRLDRLRREGVDRGPSGSTSNPGFTLPPAGTEMKEQISQLVAAWEELDAVSWMQQFDHKLDELSSLVSSGNAGESKPASPSTHPLADSWMGRVDGDAAAEDVSSSRLAGWEEMKAQLMNEGDPEGTEHPAADDGPQLAPVTEIAPAWDLEAPQPVDFEEADRDALIIAVQERDEFISHLIRRLRSAPSGPPERIDWDRLNNAPEELRERLQQLEARLEEVLRMEECDLSLERARLARERARLEQWGRKVERVQTTDESDDETDESEVSQNERRWLRVFGFGRKSDELDDLDEDDLDDEDLD